MSKEVDGNNYKSLSYLISSYLSVYEEGGLRDAIEGFTLAEDLGEINQVIHDIGLLLDAGFQEEALAKYVKGRHFMYNFVDGTAEDTLKYIKSILELATG